MTELAIEQTMENLQSSTRETLKQINRDKIVKHALGDLSFDRKSTFRQCNWALHACKGYNTEYLPELKKLRNNFLQEKKKRETEAGRARKTKQRSRLFPGYTRNLSKLPPSFADFNTNYPYFRP